MRVNEVFRDPVYGYIFVTNKTILDLINSSEFQRLRRIKQLSGAEMVYHGAFHSRFSHSLGVYHLSNKVIELTELKDLLTDRDKLLFNVSALLHDLGHGPYSHAFESVFNTDHELIASQIIIGNTKINKILLNVDNEFPKDVSNILLKKGNHKLIEQLITSQLDIDRMDYLLRDAYYTGVSFGNVDVDRLIRVMNFKDDLVLFKKSGIHSIENYLLSRYHMYWQVYYHRVTVAHEIVLEKIYLRVTDLINNKFKFKTNIDILKTFLQNKNDINNYLLIDDYYINGIISNFRLSEDLILRELANDFFNRKIWKYIDYNENDIINIKSLLTDDEIKYFTSTNKSREVAYMDESLSMGSKILILKNSGEISTLGNESLIIKSLINSGEKVDKKFYYRGKSE